MCFGSYTISFSPLEYDRDNNRAKGREYLTFGDRVTRTTFSVHSTARVILDLGWIARH